MENPSLSKFPFTCHLPASPLTLPAVGSQEPDGAPVRAHSPVWSCPLWHFTCCPRLFNFSALSYILMDIQMTWASGWCGNPALVHLGWCPGCDTPDRLPGDVDVAIPRPHLRAEMWDSDLFNNIRKPVSLSLHIPSTQPTCIPNIQPILQEKFFFLNVC